LHGMSPRNSAKVGESRMRNPQFVSALILAAGIADSAYRAQNQSSLPGIPPVVGPRIIHLLKPDCSAEQSCHGIHGAVAVTVDVLTDGTAGDVDVTDSGGDERLKEAAIAAAKKCRFKPGTFKGKPTTMSYGLTYKF
jgi:TonB family protein